MKILNIKNIAAIILSMPILLAAQTTASCKDKTGTWETLPVRNSGILSGSNIYYNGLYTATSEFTEDYSLNESHEVCGWVNSLSYSTDSTDITRFQAYTIYDRIPDKDDYVKTIWTTKKAAEHYVETKCAPVVNQNYFIINQNNVLIGQ